MGNGMSEEEEHQFMEEAYNMSLDNPDVDKKINRGTTASNCQPKHTKLLDELSSESEEEYEEADQIKSDGHEVISSPSGNIHIHDTKSPRLRKKIPKKTGNGNHSAQQESNQRMQSEREKKLSYLQMAKIGYQELVNAIIRPPRADYKVSIIFIKIC